MVAALEGAKLVQRWIGPFEVQQRINANTYRLRLPDNYPGSPVVNLRHLKRCWSSDPKLGSRQTLGDTCVVEPARKEYEVEGTVGHRYDKKLRTMLHLTRCVGYSPSYDLWLTAKDLRNAPDVLFDYQKWHVIRA